MEIFKTVMANVISHYVDDPEDGSGEPGKVPLHVLPSAQDDTIPPSNTRSMFLVITDQEWANKSKAEQVRLFGLFRILIQDGETELEETWDFDHMETINDYIPCVEVHSKCPVSCPSAVSSISARHGQSHQRCDKIGE